MSLDSTGLFAFFASFAIVCSLWYFHHRLFETFFVPKALPIVLNFVWLSIVVLLAYVSVHSSEAGFAYRTLTLTYFSLYALAYAILAAQTLLGLFERRSAPVALRTRGLRQIAHMTFWTLVFVACSIEVQVLPWAHAVGSVITWTFVAGGLGSVLLSFYFRRRRAANADATGGASLKLD